MKIENDLAILLSYNNVSVLLHSLGKDQDIIYINHNLPFHDKIME